MSLPPVLHEYPASILPQPGKEDYEWMSSTFSCCPMPWRFSLERLDDVSLMIYHVNAK
jgi:hypothetical protein